MSARLHAHGDIANWPAAPAHLNDVTIYDSLPKLLARNAEIAPDEVAQREKDLGIWNAVTWRDFNNHVARIAIGFAELGLGPGDVVGIIGDNRPEWIWSEIAAHAVRAHSLGFYRDTLEDEVAYLINYAQPKIIVAEDEEQVDKFLNLEDRIPSVRRIIYHDPKGMRKYDDPRLMTLAAVEEIGAKALSADPERYARMVAATSGADVGVLCTTSGTTSNPKLAEWRNAAFLGQAATYLRADPKGPEDEYLAVLPLPWVMEQMYSVAWNLVSRMTVNFPEEQDTAMADMREIGPTFILLSPRAWEAVSADVRARMMDASRWKQAVYEWGVSRGVAAIERGGRDALAEKILFRQLRDRLGFARLTSAATGGAAMGPDTFKFFQAMGVPLKQLYGQTEALGAHTVHKDGHIDNETVGFPMPDCELMILDPDSEGLGEILVRHANMMAGYYKNPEATDETFDADGWFHTGDAGYLNDEGHLIVIDRIKDLAVTSTGVKFSPQFIENKLKFSTYVAEAVILGKDRPFITAAICIRYPIVSKWAEQRRIAFTTYTDLSANRDVYALLKEEVAKVNATLPEAQRIRKFVLLYKELDADDGELTRTKKVRRGVITEKYGDIIDTLYSNAEAIDIDTEINFQDGSKQRIVTSIKVERMDAALLEAAE